MKINFKNIISLLLLSVFFLPTIIKFEHRHEHEHFICKTKTEKHFHDYQVKCDICNFEFSVYAKVSIKADKPNIQYFSNYSNLYCSSSQIQPLHFSFLLRAPPLNKKIS